MEVEEELKIVSLSRLIKSLYVSKLKFVATGLGEPIGAINNDHRLFHVYTTLKTYFPADSHEAVSFIDHVLVLLGHAATGLTVPESYDVRVKYPGVDIRLLALEFVDHLQKKRELRLLREYLHIKRRIPYDTAMKSVVSLTKAMFDEQVITQISDLTQLASCFNLEEITSDYNTRHQLQGQGEVEGQGALEDLEKLKTNVKNLRKKRKNRQKQVFCIMCVVIPLTVVSIVAFSVVVATSLVPRWSIPNTPGFVNVTDNSTVLVDDVFNKDLNNIELTLVTNSDKAQVDVYRQSCKDVESASIDLLPQAIPFPFVEYFKRQPCNYYGQDRPLYGLKGTTVTYHISASSRLLHPGCPKISIFRDNDLYNDAIKPNVNGENNSTHINGIIAQSPCLSVNNSNPSAPSSWEYTFNETGYVYSTIDEGAYMTITGNISVALKVYELHNLQPVCTDESTLTTDSTKCNIDVCGSLCLKHRPRSCIFLRSNGLVPVELKYTTKQPILLREEMVFGIFVILFVLVLTFIFSICYCNGCPMTKRRVNGSYYRTDLEGDDDFVFVT